MTMPRTATLSKIGTKTIPPDELAYFRRRLSNHIYATVVNEFLRLEKAGLITRAGLAKSIQREPAQVTRWLGSSGNWEIATLSDLLRAMGYEASILLHALPEENVPAPAQKDLPRFASSDPDAIIDLDERMPLGAHEFIQTMEIGAQASGTGVVRQLANV